MRELRIRLEQELETEDRIAQARQARVERGEQPFTDLELREGYDPDGPSALRKPSMAAEAAPPPLAGAHLAGEQDEDRPPPTRKTITGDPDVDDLLYAIDSKNDLAIEQALKRVANSAHSAALANGTCASGCQGAAGGAGAGDDAPGAGHGRLGRDTDQPRSSDGDDAAPVRPRARDAERAAGRWRRRR